jgi:glycosyltransferase involved in cell wall biosynthesis
MMNQIVPDVAVLMATFNGEKWLDEQIDSIFSQRGVNPKLYVFDDFSTDGTLFKLLAWQGRGFPIHLVEKTSHKLGAAGAYFHLVNQNYSEPFLSFADQDDIWRENHLIQSIEALGTQGPGVVFSPREYIDGTGKTIGKSSNLLKPISISNAIVENIAYGNTIVMNLEFQKKISLFIPETFVMHDSWIYLYAMTIDAAVRIESASVCYRIHSRNTVGIRSKLNMRKAVSGIRNFIEQDIEFLRIFDSQKSFDTRVICEFIESVTTLKLIERVRYCASSKCYRQDSLENILLKACIILYPKIFFRNSE